MPDVITYARSGQPLNNHGATIFTNMQGNKQTLDYNSSNSEPSLANIESVYDNRFDDPSYYFGS